jgi:hypothetical protein
LRKHSTEAEPDFLIGLHASVFGFVEHEEGVLLLHRERAAFVGDGDVNEITQCLTAHDLDGDIRVSGAELGGVGEIAAQDSHHVLWISLHDLRHILSHIYFELTVLELQNAPEVVVKDTEHLLQLDALVLNLELVRVGFVLTQGRV